MSTSSTAETEIAWAAGFFDGEGSAGRNRNPQHRRPHLHLQLSQVRREPLDRFVQAVGAGRVYGPYERKGRRPFYQWQVYGSNAERVAGLLEPYLSAPKREQLAGARAGGSI